MLHCGLLLNCSPVQSKIRAMEQSMDEEVARLFAIRDSFRKKLAARETYSQRMQKMAILQEATWKALRASPTGWAHFLRRNFKARAIDISTPNATRNPTS